MLTKWLLFSCSCSKELGQWDLLMEFGKTKGHANPFLGKLIWHLLHLLIFIVLRLLFHALVMINVRFGRIFLLRSFSLNFQYFS